jgi:twinkle protein
MTKVLGEAAQKFFTSRKIETETAARFGIFTAKKSGDEIVPDASGQIIVFPFARNGKEYAEKFRAPDESGRHKRMWQRKGSQSIFWNVDVLDDPLLEDSRNALIICEGEIDALTAIDCGFPLTVSVPAGAPPEKEDDSEDEQPLSPEAEKSGGKFQFLWRSRNQLKRIKRFIIAVDNDGPGQRLASEIVRRLSAGRCMFVTYPDGCKDLNDVRVKHGADAVRDVIQNAKPYPVKGLYRLSDYPEVGEPKSFSTGWASVDEYLRLWLGEFMIITGVPNHGKSTWALGLCANLARRHLWKICVASFEIPTVPYLRDKLRSGFIGHTREAWTAEDIQRADKWIERDWVFIDYDPRSDDDDIDLDWVLDKATEAVFRDGINVLLVDPWNEVEHRRRKDESQTEYVGRAIRQLKRFARSYNVVVIVVAHPTKEVGKDGKHRPVTLYDVEGSAHWYNKPDHGVIIECSNLEANETTVYVKKVRFKNTGRRGQLIMRFNPHNETYSEIDMSQPVYSAGGASL